MAALVARRVPTGVAAVATALIFAGAANAASTATPDAGGVVAADRDERGAPGERPAAAPRRRRGSSAPPARTARRCCALGPSPTAPSTRASAGPASTRRRVGENLAWGQGSLGVARSIVAMWLASPEHRANLLHPGYRIVGVGALRGCFDGRRHTLMVTTDFAGR